MEAEMQKGEVILYHPSETIKLEVRLENETVWLTVEQMGMLFDKEASNIRRHIINIFNEHELNRDNNVHFLHVNGVKKPVPFYSLDVIISVGYRVKSLKGTQFRIWANSILKQYLLKGYNIHPQLSVIQNQIIALQEHTDNRIQDIERHLEHHDEQIDLYIKTNEPNKEQLFGNGCVFEAWSFISDPPRGYIVNICNTLQNI